MPIAEGVKRPGETRGMRPARKMVSRPAIELTRFEKNDLENESLCDRRTIERWADGEPVLATTAQRLDRALKKKGIEVRIREAKRRIIGGAAA